MLVVDVARCISPYDYAHQKSPTSSRRQKISLHHRVELQIRSHRPYFASETPQVSSYSEMDSQLRFRSWPTILDDGFLAEEAGVDPGTPVSR